MKSTIEKIFQVRRSRAQYGVIMAILLCSTQVITAREGMMMVDYKEGNGDLSSYVPGPAKTGAKVLVVGGACVLGLRYRRTILKDLSIIKNTLQDHSKTLKNHGIKLNDILEKLDHHGGKLKEIITNQGKHTEGITSIIKRQKEHTDTLSSVKKGMEDLDVGVKKLSNKIDANGARTMKQFAKTRRDIARLRKENEANTQRIIDEIGLVQKNQSQHSSVFETILENLKIR